jgi:hypothetical protein
MASFFAGQAGRFVGKSLRGKMHGARRPASFRMRPLVLELLEAREVPASWTALAHAAPSSLGTMMLLSDGTVMANGGGSAGCSTSWYRLTPDAYGSYVNGTWSTLAPMSLGRLYYASNVLQDGRVFVLGGEYSGGSCGSNFSNTGQIYDPIANSWSNIANFPQSQFGDDPSEVLPDGRVFTGYVSGVQTYIYNPATNAWSFAANKLNGDQSDEETWIKLPDDSILTWDVFSPLHSQRYVPSQNKWVDAGVLPAAMTNSGVGYEAGPATLLPDGRAFFVGATNKTALYDPATNSWTAGPNMPTGVGADDAPGAMLPNGHFVFAADHPLFNPPTTLYDYDPVGNTLTAMSGVPSGLGLSNKPSYVTRMLVLPSGQLLYSSGTSLPYVYTPDGVPDQSWKPTVSNVSHVNGNIYQVAGTQLNGISEGASYGDDAEMSSNYPIVRIVNDANKVFYARTYNWSSTGVATGNTPVSTYFTLPAGIRRGNFQLSVVANGIASDPVAFTITPPGPGPGSGPGGVLVTARDLGSGGAAPAPGAAPALPHAPVGRQGQGGAPSAGAQADAAPVRPPVAHDGTQTAAGLAESAQATPAATILVQRAVDAAFAGDPLAPVL